MNLRFQVFNFLDRIKGSTINNNLKEIKSINESIIEDTINSYQNEKIGILIENISKNVPFYKNKSKSIEKLEVVDKSKIKNNFNEFLSVEYEKNELTKVITSGSTGTPFVSYQNEEKRFRNSADAIYFGGKAGYNLGELLFYLKIWSTNNNKSFFERMAQNIYPVDVINFSGDKIDKFIKRLHSIKKPININSYSSALERLCDYMDSKKPSLNFNKVNSIISQSEALPIHTKKRLKKYFNIDACSRYSNVENGVIAQQTLAENNLFKINRASYYLEILKLNSDEPAQKNELGRIVITDLFNFSMPFIRYDTGDIGCFFVDNTGRIDKNYLSKIEGRKLDILLNTKGEIVSSYIMYKNMFKYPEIDQFQLIQQDYNNYDFIICIKSSFTREKELKDEFLRYLGKDANFLIKYVNEIPLLSSGKRRKIVNNYIKNKNII